MQDEEGDLTIRARRHEELLKTIPLFESLTDDELKSLARRLDHAEFSAGDKIFGQGESGSAAFIIENGAVEISYGSGTGKVVLANLFAGQYFGELSLFDGAPRSATATSTRPSRLLRLDRDDFIDFVNKTPAAALRIISEMSERLRQTNELMSQQVSRNVLEEAEDRLTRSQRVADRVARVAGSWPFIGAFIAVMFVWMGINIVELSKFDPYPFILLNLALAMVAAIQAPIIMMSQNRQSSKDKLLAENDYQVNLKAEMEIAALMRGQAEMMARLTLIERATTRRASDATDRGTRAITEASGPGPRVSD